jgi:hypothetical protein
MAPWLVTFHLVPRRTMASAPGALTSAVLESTDWWASSATPADFGARLAAIAAPAHGPVAGVESWGPPDGNGVDVHRRGGRVSRIVARVDVRKLDPKFSAALLAFVRSSQAVLVRTDGRVAEPTVGAFSGALRSDPAWQHANEPAPMRIVNGVLEDYDE